MPLFCFWYHAVFISGDLQYGLRESDVMPAPGLLFLLQIASPIQDPLCFRMEFRAVLYTSMKIVIGIFMVIALILSMAFTADEWLIKA